ncbi:MAG: hypothetical protein H6661_01530 [Ardenticatenaceae bacterium]|nr:hypothetical protein [Ardenticatenaceae bacterium]
MVVTLIPTAAAADRVVHLKMGSGRLTVNNPPASNHEERMSATGNALSANKIVACWPIQSVLHVSQPGAAAVRNVLTAAGVLINIITLVAMGIVGVGVTAGCSCNFEDSGPGEHFYQ